MKNADLYDLIDVGQEDDDISLVFLSPKFQSIQDSISEEDEDDSASDDYPSHDESQQNATESESSEHVQEVAEVPEPDEDEPIAKHNMGNFKS